MGIRQDAKMAKAALKKKPIIIKDSKDQYLNSGSTVFNLNLSGRRSGAFKKGHYYFFVGDSESGKTFIVLTCLAEASISEAFKDYRLIYDAPERGALMNIVQFFGQKVADRLEPPGGTREEPEYSETVDDFYYYLDDAYKDGRPFLYILDSMDALDTEEGYSKFLEKKAVRRGSKKEARGSYGADKAKSNSGGMPRVISRLAKRDSMLFVIGQTRDNVGTFSFNKKTKSGGHALDFYATVTIWTSIKEKIRKRVRGKDRAIGLLSKVHIKKNRVSGRDRTFLLPIYNSVGIDDLGSCINYLIEEKHWRSPKVGDVVAKEFKFKGSIEELIQKIESKGLESRLRSIVSKVWHSIESECRIERKSRYL